MRRRRRYRARAKNGKSLLWWISWPVHTPFRYLLWWLKEFVAGLLIGLVQGVRIAWYEIRARHILTAWDEQGVIFYDTPIWGLLRDITFERYRTSDGGVICRDCKMVTHRPHCHHIVPISRDRSLAFTPSNLVGLCAWCHDKKHPDIRITP